MKIRGYQHPPALEGYYELVGAEFATRLDTLIGSLPISREESKYIGLPMLNKIEMPEDAEETPFEDEAEE